MVAKYIFFSGIYWGHKQATTSIYDVFSDSQRSPALPVSINGVSNEDPSSFFGNVEPQPELDKAE